MKENAAEVFSLLPIYDTNNALTFGTITPTVGVYIRPETAAVAPESRFQFLKPPYPLFFAFWKP